MAAIEIHQFACLSDNYGFLVHEPEGGLTACIDTPEVGPILDALREKGWSLTHIWNTHHHFDHAGGNLELKERTGCRVVGPRADRDRIPGLDDAVGDGDRFAFGDHEVQVFDVPGHTRGHIAYWLPQDEVAFVGDTLFALGCGRLFEGSPRQMWSSLQKLMALPPQTRIYCAHEYTQANARFALTVDPENADLVARAAAIDGARARGVPTVPTTLAEELRTNPFLRAEQPGLQRALGMAGADPVDVFAETRRRKDSF